MKKFRRKKHLKTKIIKSLIIILAIYLIFNIFFLFCNKVNLKYIDFIDISFKTNKNKSSKKIINKTYELLTNTKIKNPVTFLENAIQNSDPDILNREYEDDYESFNKSSKVTEYIPDPNSKQIENPVVYIYNTHQLENYKIIKPEIYNIKPNVMMTSHILKEKLNELEISTIVEQVDLIKYMRLNNLRFKDSYKASRVFAKKAIKEKESIKYLIDIHRDSVKYNNSTIEIKGKKYAKILFVVGLENKNYESNLKMTKAIHNIIKKDYPKLSKGILTKKGKNVDGVYNQDLSPNSILIEFGGYQNTITEVFNTTEIVAKAIYNYIKGE